jgi:hypothetical protein
MASPQVVPPESPFMISLLMPFSVYTIRPKEKKKSKHTPKQTFTTRSYIIVHIHKNFNKKKVYQPRRNLHTDNKTTLATSSNIAKK